MGGFTYLLKATVPLRPLHDCGCQRHSQGRDCCGAALAGDVQACFKACKQRWPVPFRQAVELLLYL